MRGKSFRLFSSATALVVSAVMASPVGAAVYSPPYADIFSFLYGGDSTGKSLDTRVSGDRAVAPLGSAGYHTFDDVNHTASSSMGSAYAQSDAIWVHLGHARPGAALFYNGSSYSELLASTSMSPLVSTWGEAYLGSTTGLTDLRLMVFAGCDTADNVDATIYHNNLLNVAVSRGVDSTLGFKGTIYWPWMNYWSDMFFTNLKQGKTINQAAVNAQDYVLYASGISYFGTDTWYALGGGLKVMPVGYGS